MTVLSDFIASVKEWIDDLDPSDGLVTQWVRLAETRMNDELRTDEQVARVSATFDDNCAVLPADWLETLYVRPAGGRPFGFISNRDYFNLIPAPMPFQAAPPVSDTVYPWSRKGHFTNIGRTIFVWPPIDPLALTQFEIAYYQRIPPLDNVQTPVFVRYPSIYLNCTLAAAAPYLIEDERLNVFSALATAQIKTANDAATAARFSGSPLSPAIRGFG
jgi:hypothetical protein